MTIPVITCQYKTSNPKEIGFPEFIWIINKTLVTASIKKEIVNIYGDGTSSKRIVNILEEIKIDTIKIFVDIK